MTDPNRQTLAETPGARRHRRGGSPDEPPWLTTLRDEARRRRDRLDYPSGREERWRFTDVPPLHDERYDERYDERFAPLPAPGVGVAGVPAAARPAWEQTRSPDTGAALLVDGAPAEIRLPRALDENGVVLTSLAEAARRFPDRVRPHLGRQVGAQDVFTAGALAGYRGGLFLYVPAGVTVEAPVRWLQWLENAGAAVDSRALVVLEAGASLHLEDRLLSPDLERPTRVQPVLELVVGPDARLSYTGWQQWGAGVRQLAHVQAHVERGGRFRSMLVGLGADLARMHHQVTLAGEGSEADLLGAYFPTGEQQHEFWTVQEHRAPHTRSDLLYKGALGDAGRAVYYGTIRVGPEARRTDAYQANRNLLLSRRARVDTNPQLEIETNDVRCTHGATVGQVDEEQLFYLMSRGIPRPQAERLLVAGFFSEPLSRYGDESLEARIAEGVRRKLEALEPLRSPDAPDAPSPGAAADAGDAS